MFPQGELKICIPLPLKVLEVVLEARLFGKLHAFLYYGLFGRREMQGFFRIRGIVGLVLLLLLFVGFMYPCI